MENEPLITRDEVCELLKISRVSIWRYTKEGKIPHYKIGRRLLFKRSEVLKSMFIDKNK